MVCELSLAADLSLFSWITTLCRFCFNFVCIGVGLGFGFPAFDMADSLGFAFDIYCTKPFSCISEPFGFELLTLPSVALFFD